MLSVGAKSLRAGEQGRAQRVGASLRRQGKVTREQSRGSTERLCPKPSIPPQTSHLQLPLSILGTLPHAPPQRNELVFRGWIISMWSFGAESN